MELELGPRGGVAINDHCQTSDENIYAIGECASWNEMFYGLVAPGYKMATVAVDHLLGNTESKFEGADMSAKLKLLGVKVALSVMRMAVQKVVRATFIKTKSKKFTNVLSFLKTTRNCSVRYWWVIRLTTAICFN